MSGMVMTGPIQGELTVSDGTVYDVSPEWVECADEHAAELADLIGRYYAENGHPLVDGPFRYDPPEE